MPLRPILVLDDECSADCKSVHLPRGSCYVGRIAFRDQLDWIGTAWVLAARLILPRHSGPNLTRRKMEAFAAANVSAPSRTDIYCEIVYGFVQRGCHDIRHSRIERRTKRRHDSHQSRRCRRQSSRTGAFGLASTCCRRRWTPVRPFGLR